MEKLRRFLPLSEAEIQGLLHPAEANLGFQSPQLPSTQSESPLALYPMRLLKHVLNCEQNCSLFTRISIRINCNRISEGLL
jgi:hypothetical protein